MNMITPVSDAAEIPRGGTLSVRLAKRDVEIDAAQALRYAVFYEEMGARPDAMTLLTRRDRDRHDAVADHLIVVDETASDLPCGIVATYRLIDADAAAGAGGFYSAGEFDIAPLLGAGRVLELGRSCVHPRYRSGAVLQLLWRGIAEYVHPRKSELLFGCASLPGIDPEAVADQLAVLGHHYLAPAAIRPVALPGRFVELRRKAEGDFDARQAFMRLPPLLKGYLRLGGTVGDGAVIDVQFNTIDVALVVSTERITSRYLRHYVRNGGVAA
ncbi:MAG: GNAT family N-acetyltransferase [Alphaproteobacteria bacterium]|nr:GNAT family N-acetyltransferase [Alphaproteobacteria bacterium]